MSNPNNDERDRRFQPGCMACDAWSGTQFPVCEACGALPDPDLPDLEPVTEESEDLNLELS